MIKILFLNSKILISNRNFLKDRESEHFNSKLRISYIHYILYSIILIADSKLNFLS